MDCLGLLKALCPSALRFGSGSPLWHPKAGGILRQKPHVTDQESYLIKGEPERCWGHLKTFCGARNHCWSHLPLPAPNLHRVDQRLPRAGELLCARSDGRSRISVFLPALVPQPFWPVFIPNGKRIMRNCLNNLRYKETHWSKVQR